MFKARPRYPYGAARRRALAPCAQMIRALSALAAALVVAEPVSAYASPGDVDRGFGNDGRVLVALPFGFVVRASGVDGAGRTVVVGAASPGEDRVLRFLPDGALDASYGSGGAVDLASVSEPFTVVVKPDGRAHVFGDTTQAVLDTTGRSLLDRTHSSVSWPGSQPGVIDTVADGPGDTVLVAGRSVDDHPFVMRLRADGRLDSRFGKRGFSALPGPWFIPGGVIQDRRGRLLVGGSTNRRALVERLTARGRLDTAFADGGRAQIAPPRGLKGWNARYLALDARNRIVVAGSGWTKDQDVGAFRPVIARLKARESPTPSQSSIHLRKNVTPAGRAASPTAQRCQFGADGRARVAKVDD